MVGAVIIMQAGGTGSVRMSSERTADICWFMA